MASGRWGAGVALALLLTLQPDPAGARAAQQWVIGKERESCEVACGALGRKCTQSVFDRADVATALRELTSCQGDVEGETAGVGPKGECQIQEHIGCGGAVEGFTQPLCRCGASNEGMPYFGTGCSGCTVFNNETTFFTHRITDTGPVPPHHPSPFGMMTHFWSTSPAGTESSLIFRYYVDGETAPSLEFSPSLAAGVGFDNGVAPWGTKWIGLGAGQNGTKGNPKNGQAWFHNLRVPFYKSIRVTVLSALPMPDKLFFLIVRGAYGTSQDIGYPIPGIQNSGDTYLKLHTFKKHVQPLEYVDIVDVPAGSKGYFFYHTIAVKSGNLNFLEGCYHAYSPPSEPFPGTLLSTGTEDFFDSGWYFDAGEFHMPVSGMTNMNLTSGVHWSAYRFHEMDPLPFDDGFKLRWRNGDMVRNGTYLKCFTESGGTVVGHPTPSEVTVYAWYYVKR